MATPNPAQEAEEVLTVIDHKGLGDGDILIEDGTMEFLDSVIEGTHQPEDPIEEEVEVPSGDVVTYDEDTVQQVKPAAAQPQPAEVPAKKNEEQDLENDGSEARPTEDRKRAYLGHITDPVTLQAIQLIEANPKLSLAKAEELAKQALGIEENSHQEDDGTVSYDDLPLTEKIEFDTVEFKEISQQIIEKERLGIHDDEWETLVVKKDELSRVIAKNELRLEMLNERNEADAKAVAETQRDAINVIESTEKELAVQYPDLEDEDSLLYAAVSNASTRLMERYEDGKAPDWFKPASPDSMRRIVQEQHERITGKKAPVAKPGAAEASASTHARLKGPVAAKPAHAVAQLRSIPESGITTTPQIIVSGNDDDFMASLDGLIAGKATPRRSSSKFEIV